MNKSEKQVESGEIQDLKIEMETKNPFIIVSFERNCRKFVSACPLNWLSEGTLYWPKPTKSENDTILKIRNAANVEQDWLIFKKYKLLLDGEVFGKPNSNN